MEELENYSEYTWNICLRFDIKNVTVKICNAKYFHIHINAASVFKSQLIIAKSKLR